MTKSKTQIMKMKLKNFLHGSKPISSSIDEILLIETLINARIERIEWLSPKSPEKTRFFYEIKLGFLQKKLKNTLIGFWIIDWWWKSHYNVVIIEIESEEIVEDGGFWKWWVFEFTGFWKRKKKELDWLKYPFSLF